MNINENYYDGIRLHRLVKRLWPINRSITGQGVRDTLAIIKEHIPEMSISEIPSGSKVFDWVVPDEWEVAEAYIEDEFGNIVVDVKDNNLHLVGYSISVDKLMSLNELQAHLHSLESLPNAIPYVTSYYERNWGFCLPHNQRVKLLDCNYRVVIKANHFKGFLNYGELILYGECKKEVLISTYVCHPSMANNELSGPVISLALAKWLQNFSNRKYTYRFIFIPETIGSIAYLSKNINHLKKYVIAGYNISCVGDEADFSYLPSRNGETLSDRAALCILGNEFINFKKYTWLDRGSDERQYCAPGVDLPIASIMRSKYGEYYQYHTSLDDLSFVTAKGLNESLDIYRKVLICIEANCYPKAKFFCEPHLSKRGLYPSISKVDSSKNVQMIMDLISYCDGSLDLIAISRLIKVPFLEALKTLNILREHHVLDVYSDPNPY